MTPELTTEYLGLTLKTPVVAASCPLTGDIDALKRLEAAGAGAAVLPSLFEEQIEFEEQMFGGLMDYGAESFVEAATYFPEMDNYNTGPDEYLELIEQAREAVEFPIIASLNGVTTGGWTRYAKLMEDAGASALELNVYYLSTDPNVTSEQIESNYIELVQSIKSTVSIPLSIKLGPFFSSLPNFARNLAAAGADGLVLFNRFMQPDLNVDRMEIDSRLELSNRSDIRLPMRWIAVLDPLLPETSLASTTGARTATDVLKMLLVGADVTQVATVLLQRGPDVVASLVADLRTELEERGYRSVTQLKGSCNHRNTPDPAAFERNNYMKALTTYVGDSI